MHKRLAASSVYVCEGLESRVLLSGAALVKDLNPGTLGGIVAPLGRLGTSLLYAEDDGVHGKELYITDGTAAGTNMVADLVVGSGDGVAISPASDGAVLNSAVYFSGIASGLPFLFKSDGTVGGTVAVKQLSTLTTANGSGFTSTVSKVFFNVGTSTTPALWVSDGTTAGTQPMSALVSALAPLSTQSMLVVNNKLFFVGVNASLQQFLYVTDGTAAGTILLKSSINDLGLFSAGTKLLTILSTNTAADIWASSGTVAGTIDLKSFVRVDSFGSGPSHAFVMAIDNASNIDSLYAFTGVPAGTQFIETGFVPSETGIGVLPNGSALFFSKVSGVDTLFRSDGSTAGTIQLAQLSASASQGFSVYDIGSVGVFAADDASHGNALWKSDGTVAGTLVILSNPRLAADPSGFLGGSPIYFAANDGLHGNELWKTDGTAAGTVQVADVNLKPASSNPGEMTLINGKIWLAATNVNGTLPWTSDGTAAGTQPVTNDPSIDYDPLNDFFGFGPKTYFVASGDANFTQRLFSSDGTSIVPVTDASGQPPETLGATTFNNLIYFVGRATGVRTLWKSDGTAVGTTQILTTMNPTGGFLAVGSTLFATGQVGNIEQLFAVNTANQITQLTSFSTSFVILAVSAVFNGNLYFLLDNGTGQQLWRSDGTPAGTSLVKQLTTGEVGLSTARLIAANGALYMTVKDTSNSSNMDLFKSDGTSSGTTLVKVVTAATGLSNELVGADGRVYFAGISSVGGSTSAVLWVSDGTPANTIPLMSGLTTAPNVSDLVASGSSVYFDARDTAHGAELWKSDGTVAGTKLAVDIIPGTASGGPFAMAQIGGALYMAADDGTHGVELMKVFDQDTITGTAGNDTIKLAADADNISIDWATSADSGQLPINDPAGLTINGNGGSDTVDLVAGSTLPSFLHLNGIITINGLFGSNPFSNTNVDINASTIFLTYKPGADPVGSIRADLRTGYNNGLWNSSARGAIVSSAAALDASHASAVGYADSVQGITPLPANTFELKYTLYGDTGLAGTVGFNDFTRMTQHFTQAVRTWGQGDFNYDGTVNVLDFNLLKPNYGQSLLTNAPLPPVQPVVAVPADPAPSPTGLRDSTKSTTTPPPPAGDSPAEKKKYRVHGKTKRR